MDNFSGQKGSNSPGKPSDKRQEDAPMSYQEYPNQLIMKAATKAPYLEREQELDLAIRWAENKDQEALHELTSAHMRLVISLAFKFKRYGFPL